MDPNYLQLPANGLFIYGHPFWPSPGQPNRRSCPSPFYSLLNCHVERKIQDKELREVPSWCGCCGWVDVAPLGHIQSNMKKWMSHFYWMSKFFCMIGAQTWSTQRVFWDQKKIGLLGAAMASAAPQVPLGDCEPQRPKVDCSDLAIELEKLPSVRTYLEENKSALFPETLNLESVHVVKEPHIFDIMKVLLTRASPVEGHPSPSIDDLRCQMPILYEKCSVVVDSSTTDADAWSIRKIIAFIKMKVRRSQVSTATFLNYFNWSWFISSLVLWKKYANEDVHGFRAIFFVQSCS